MNNWSDIFAPLIGRILMGGYFLWNGIEAVLNFPVTTVTLATAGVPAPADLGMLAIAIEVACGLALIVGFGTRLAAVILTIFVMVNAMIYINLDITYLQSILLRDVAIIGGLLYVSAYGAGMWTPNWKFKQYK